MNPIDRAYNAVEARVMALRHRSKYFDHLSRAVLRYDEVNGGRLAAAIAYYGFFAIFALLLIGFSIFGILLTNNAELFAIVREFLGQNLPFLDLQQVLDSGRTVGVVGLIGLVFTGVAWVEAIRSSQRLIWRLNQHPGYIILRQVVDLAVLLGVLILIALSVLAVSTLERLLAWAFDGHAPWLLGMVSWILTVAINMLLAAALLAAVPRLRMTARRMLPPVLQVGLGLYDLERYTGGRPDGTVADIGVDVGDRAAGLEGGNEDAAGHRRLSGIDGPDQHDRRHLGEFLGDLLMDRSCHPRII